MPEPCPEDAGPGYSTNTIRRRTALILIFVLVFISVYFIPLPTRRLTHHVYIDEDFKDAEVSPMFLSIGLDMSFINKTMPELTKNDWRKLEEYARALSPALLRLGGNAADLTVFRPMPTVEDHLVVTYETIKRFCQFVNSTNLKFVYDFNAMLRSDSEWNSTNAKQFLAYNQNCHIDFQLGNEPNSYLHKYNKAVSPNQLAIDYKNLRNLLNTYEYHKNSLLVGPEVTHPKGYTSALSFLKEFLPDADEFIDAITWHQYYLNGRTATLNDFMDANVMDSLMLEIIEVLTTIHEANSSKPAWLTETGSAYGGGAEGLSDRYVSTFLWLDKLGLAARMGVELVIRHGFVQGNYAMIDNNISPLPDFWISAFYKKLVGPIAYPVLVKTADSEVRIYAHSAIEKTPCISNLTYASLVVFGINLHNQETEVTILAGREFIICAVYAFTSDDLQSKDIMMNGRKLVWDNPEFDLKNYDDTLMSMNGVMPPYSSVFWLFS